MNLEQFSLLFVFSQIYFIFSCLNSCFFADTAVSFRSSYVLISLNVFLFVTKEKIHRKINPGFTKL